MSEKLDAISFFEQSIGGYMVFVMMRVNHHFYDLVFQEFGQLFQDSIICTDKPNKTAVFAL